MLFSSLKAWFLILLTAFSYSKVFAGDTPRAPRHWWADFNSQNAQIYATEMFDYQNSIRRAVNGSFKVFRNPTEEDMKIAGKDLVKDSQHRLDKAQEDRKGWIKHLTGAMSPDSPDHDTIPQIRQEIQELDSKIKKLKSQIEYGKKAMQNGFTTLKQKLDFLESVSGERGIIDSYRFSSAQHFDAQMNVALQNLPDSDPKVDIRVNEESPNRFKAATKIAKNPLFWGAGLIVGGASYLREKVIKKKKNGKTEKASKMEYPDLTIQEVPSTSE